MRRVLVAALLAAWVALGAAALPAQADTLVVLEKSGFRTTLIDAATKQVLARLPTGQGPHEVAISPDGRTAYVSDYGLYDIYPPGDETHTRKGNTVTVVDLVERKVKATWNLGNHTGPHHPGVSRDGRVVWVTVEMPQGLLELDAETGRILKVFESKQDRTHMFAITPDETKFYLTNTVSGSTSVVNRATGAVKVLNTGPVTEAIAISPDGREVWVAARDGHTISVISTATDEVVATFSSGGMAPVRIAFTADGSQAWVTNARSNQVAVFDARSRNLLGRVDLGENPSNIVFSSDGQRAYITCQVANTVAVVDVANRRVIENIPMQPGAQPDGLALVASR